MSRFFDSAQRRDTTSILVSNKRGIYPTHELAPAIPLSEWLRPNDAAIALSDSLWRHCGNNTPLDQFARFVFSFLNEAVEPTADAGDFWYFPAETMKYLEGDCEDIAFLVAALLSPRFTGEAAARVAIGDVTVGEYTFPHAWIEITTCEHESQVVDVEFDALEGLDSRDVVHAPIATFDACSCWSANSVADGDLFGRAYGWRLKPPKVRIPTLKAPSIPTVCVGQQVVVHNDNPFAVEVSVGRTFGHGSAKRYEIPPGGQEKWGRCIGGACTIKLYVDGEEAWREEHRVTPGTQQNTFHARNHRLLGS